MEKLGKYEIRGKLGEGGMAVVYRARDPLLMRDLALKVINERRLGDDEASTQRFLHEAQIAASLTHQNIVTIYELGIERGSLFIAMEHLPGRDLRDLIAEKAAMTLGQKLHVAAQIARALQFAHSKGVIHRDVKPGNIRVLASGVVKLLDFGIAKVTLKHVGLGSPGMAQAQVTQPGAIVGSAAYMSPEQAQGKELTPASDVFSFGIVLQELLTYRKPFNAPDTLALLYQIAFGEPEPIGMEAGAIPLDLMHLVRGCLKKSLQERYPSFEPILHRLGLIQQVLRQDTQKKDRKPPAAPAAEHRLPQALTPRRPGSRAGLVFAAGFALGLGAGALLGAFAAGHLWPQQAPAGAAALAPVDLPSPVAAVLPLATPAPATTPKPARPKPTPATPAPTRSG